MTTNEYIREKWGDRPQIDLAKEIAKRRGCKEDYNAYKGYVNKWFKTEQEPGKEYLLLLSEILGVTVESILRGEDVINEYGDRATAYAAAISGDERIIQRLFGNAREDVCLDDKDEYAKSFVDYVIEFKNYRAFQIAVNRGYNYPTKWGKYLELNPEASNVDFKLTEMIVEADDLEMFKKAFGRLYQDVESPHAVFGCTIDGANKIPMEIAALILKKHGRILDWLTQTHALTKEEWGKFNSSEGDKCVTLLNSEDNYVWEIPSMVYGYSHLLNLAIAEDSDLVETLLDSALRYMNQLNAFLGEHRSEFGISPYKLFGSEYALCFKNYLKKVWAFIPYVENVNNISNEVLRKKAEELNSAFPCLHY